MFSQPRFHDVNILGMDYLDNREEVIYNFMQKTIKLTDIQKD